MSDKCPKCGADAMEAGGFVPESFVFECCSVTMDGKFHQDDGCRVRQLEGLLRRVLKPQSVADISATHEDIKAALEDAK